MSRWVRRLDRNSLSVRQHGACNGSPGTEPPPAFARAQGQIRPSRRRSACVRLQRMYAARRVSDRGSDPESRYRLGLAESHRGERKALETLNTALDGYLARNDIKGAALASAALTITGQVAGNFRRFEEHIARLSVVAGRDVRVERAQRGASRARGVGRRAELLRPGRPVSSPVHRADHGFARARPRRQSQIRRRTHGAVLHRAAQSACARSARLQPPAPGHG